MPKRSEHHESTRRFSRHPGIYGDTNSKSCGPVYVVTYCKVRRFNSNYMSYRSLYKQAHIIDVGIYILRS